MPFFLEEMGWVEIYEYDLGFCNLHILIEVHPNEMTLMIDIKWQHIGLIEKKKKKTIYRGINL